MMHLGVLVLVSSAWAAAELPTLHYATALSGSDMDSAAGMVRDGDGNLYLAATTRSIDLPTSPGAYQPRPRVSGLYRFSGHGEGTPEALFTNGALSSVSDLAIGANPATVYAATARGLLRSGDSGSTWTPTGAPATHAALAVSTAPSNRAVVYAATDRGIFRSADAGVTWSDVSPPPLAPLLASGQSQGPLYVSPADARVVFTGFPNWYRTNDGGTSWTALEFKPTASVGFDATGVLYAAGSSQGSLGFYRTVDEGASWQRLGYTPDPLTNTGLLIAPNQTTFYAASYSGIYKSTDSGATWTKIQPAETYTLAAEPDFSTLYAAGSAGLSRSLDAGASWTSMPSVGTFNPPVSATAFSQATIRAVVLATGARFYAAPLMPTQVYVTKLTAAGTMIWATYLDGTGSDSAVAIDVDAGGSAWVAGGTSSPDFPTTPDGNALPSPLSGTWFVTKLKADGSGLLFSSAVLLKTLTSLSVAPDGSVYLAGSQAGAPPFEPCHPGTGFPCPPPNPDLAVIEHLTAGGALDWAADSADATSASLVKAAPGGGATAASGEGRIWRIDSSGSTLSSVELANVTPRALAFDAAGNLLVGGSANSDSVVGSAGSFQSASRFEIAELPSGPQLRKSGPDDGYVAAFTPTLSALWSTRFGGESSTAVKAIAAGGDGSVYIAGDTFARALPLARPFQGFFAPTQSGFIAKLDLSGSQLLWSTYVGDTRPITISGLVLDPAGNAVFSASTLDPRTAGAVPPLFTGSDIFVSSIASGLAPAPVTLDAVVNTASRSGTALVPGGLFTLRGTGFAARPLRVWFDGEFAMPRFVADNELTVLAPPGMDGVTVVAVHVEAGGSVSNTILMPVAASAPALYTSDGSGVGQAAIYNDDGSPNSAENPAARGSIVTILANALGRTGSPTAVFLDTRVAGRSSRGTRDVHKVLARVPDLAPGILFSPVWIETGGVRSQSGVYVAVK